MGLLPAYGLVDEDLTYGMEPPPLASVRRLRDPRWGPRWLRGNSRRRGSSGTARPRFPARTPMAADYQDLVLRRMEVIATNPNIALTEQPEYKRRWNTGLGRSAREGVAVLASRPPRILLRFRRPDER